MNTMNKRRVTEILADNQNTFISLTFLKKDGTKRTLNGRMNVKKGVKGNERGRITSEALKRQGYVTIKTSDGYKCFNIDQVLSIKANGYFYN